MPDSPNNREAERLAKMLEDLLEDASQIRSSLLGLLYRLAENGLQEPPVYRVNMNGKWRRMSERELHAIDLSAFDIILDLFRNELRIAESDGHQRAVDLSERSKRFRTGDLEILRVLMFYANRYFGTTNLAPPYVDRQSLSASGLSHCIGNIRKLVQDGREDGPFIRKATNLDNFAISPSGTGYTFDGRQNSYCIIIPVSVFVGFSEISAILVQPRGSQ